jgi:hypothetical protein
MNAGQDGFRGARVNRHRNLTPNRRAKMTPNNPVLFVTLEEFPKLGFLAYSFV